MMYLFFDYLEVLLGAIFIGVFCDVEQKNRYCLISSIISFFVMELCKLTICLAMRWHMY